MTKIIGFDGSRAFVKGRTGTENYSYQLLKALAKIDRKNSYVVYIRSSSVIARTLSEQSESKGTKQSRSDKSHISRACHSFRKVKIASPAKPDRNDGAGWPKNFQFKEISWLRLWTQGGLALQTFKDNPDVLFVPAHTLPIVRKPGLKTVVTVHDLGSEYLPSMHQLKQQLYLGFMQKFQLKTATKIIAVSNATKQDLIKRVGIEPEKVKVVYEGFDKELFRPVKGDTLVNSLRQYDLKPKTLASQGLAKQVLKTYFLFVGTVQPRKNLERLIRAFARLHLEGVSTFFHLRGGLQLVIAGSKGWLSDDIYNLPKQLGIEDRVKFLGYVPDEDLPALYSGAAALTFPSLFEGFGLPILEAQSCGCPVLTSNVSSMPEVAGKGAVLVDPYSVDDIVKGIERVQGTGYRVQLINQGLENVRRFSWEKCARETLEVLENI